MTPCRSLRRPAERGPASAVVGPRRRATLALTILLATACATLPVGAKVDLRLAPRKKRKK